MGVVEFERFYRAEFGRVLASVIRAVGDFHAAEEAVQEAFAVALSRWPQEGWPEKPRAWLAATARHKAIDALRRAGRFERVRSQLGREPRAESAADPAIPTEDEAISDERLRLIFTCCHPALATEAQVALALRTLCGLTTDEIARAFLIAPATLAQRLVRAKRKIRDAGIPYEVPSPDQLGQRIEAVLAVIYLVFNEGYAATAGDAFVRAELCGEAIRLARLVVEQLPSERAPRELLALLLLTDARRSARTTKTGEIVPLEDQDRTRWDPALIEEGVARAGEALRAGPPGPYGLQAGIAAEHARAAHARETDWAVIVRHYDALLAATPSPVVALNRAVAVAMSQGPEAGLAIVQDLHEHGALARNHLLWSTEAELLRRLGRLADARQSFERALELASTEAERRFLQRRIDETH